MQQLPVLITLIIATRVTVAHCDFEELWQKNALASGLPGNECPFCLGGQPVTIGRRRHGDIAVALFLIKRFKLFLLAEPVEVGDGLIPGNVYHRLILPIE